MYLGSKSRGSASVTSAAVGVPAMAAMSLKQRARASWPTFSGGASRMKWMPSTTASVWKRTSRSGTPRSSTAQSSPAPVTTEALAGKDGVSRRISSNSFMSEPLQQAKDLVEPARYFLLIQIQEKVSGVEE